MKFVYILFLLFFFFPIFADDDILNLLYQNPQVKVIPSVKKQDKPNGKTTTYNTYFQEKYSTDDRFMNKNIRKNGIDISKRILTLKAGTSIEFKISGILNHKIQYTMLEGDHPKIIWNKKELSGKKISSSEMGVLKIEAISNIAITNLCLIPENIKQKKPDILFIVIDSLRADVTGFNGSKFGVTPNLDKFSTKSFNFTKHLVNSSWTRPSTLIFFTGLYASKAFINFWDYPVFPSEKEAFYKSNILPLPAFVSKEGYLSVMIGNNPFLTDHRYIGVDTGFERVEDFSYLENDTPYLTNRFIEFWEERKKEDRPVFVFFNYNDPHKPYTPPFEYLNQVKNANNAPEKKRNYLGEVAYVDSELGKIFTYLEEKGDLQKMLIIVTSDHGEVMNPYHSVSKFNGVYTLFGHGQGLYEEDVHAPFLLKLPRQVKGEKFSNLTRSIDIFPTILDILGISNILTLDGTSMRPIWLSRERDERLYFGEGRGVIGVRYNGYNLIKKTYQFHRKGPAWDGTVGDEPSYLFDIKNDPDENVPIANEKVQKELEKYYSLGETKKNIYGIRLNSGKQKKSITFTIDIKAETGIIRVLNDNFKIKNGKFVQAEITLKPDDFRELTFDVYPDITLPIVNVKIDGVSAGKGYLGVGDKDIYPGNCTINQEECLELFKFSGKRLSAATDKPRVNIYFKPAKTIYQDEKVILEKEAMDILRKQGYVK
jgi:arylsulfatase A-like enzyme